MAPHYQEPPAIPSTTAGSRVTDAQVTAAVLLIENVAARTSVGADGVSLFPLHRHLKGWVVPFTRIVNRLCGYVRESLRVYFFEAPINCLQGHGEVESNRTEKHSTRARTRRTQCIMTTQRSSLSAASNTASQVRSKQPTERRQRRRTSPIRCSHAINPRDLNSVQLAH